MRSVLGPVLWGCRRVGLGHLGLFPSPARLRGPAKVPGDLRSQLPASGHFHLPLSGPFQGFESPWLLQGSKELVSCSMPPPLLLGFKESDLAKPLFPIHTPREDLIQGPSVSSEVHPTKARRGPLAIWPHASWSCDAKFLQQESSLKLVGLLEQASTPAT